MKLRREFWVEETSFAGLLHEDANHCHEWLSDKRKRTWIEFRDYDLNRVGRGEKSMMDVEKSSERLEAVRRRRCHRG